MSQALDWALHPTEICLLRLGLLSHSAVSDPVATGCRTRQAPLPMGFSRQERWSVLPCPPPGDLLNPGN